MAKKNKIAFKTLGCRLNQFETDALASGFRKRGYEIAGSREDADIYIVNTCTVTNQGDHKSRNAIRQAAKKKDNGLLVVTGCMADHFADKLQEDGDIDYVVVNDKKSSLIDMVEAHIAGEIVSPDSYAKDKFGFEIADHGFHTRAMIKVQDGCDNFCSYCIVPRVRGRAISRPWNDIKANINRVLEAGFKEIVLTGVNIGRYDTGDMNFEDLVEKILEMPGDFRLRISSMEPEGFGDRFLELFEHPKLTPHLHLCIQSGSEKILKDMRRMYTAKEFVEISEKLLKRYPLFNLTTDIIVGFPGETNEDFEDSCRISRELGFSHIHTFKYSVRDKTKAANMPGQVQEKIKTERSEIMREIALENRLAYFKKMLGREQTMLTEKPKNGRSVGYGENYIPLMLDREYARNEFIKVKLEGINSEGEPVMTAIPTGR